MDELLATVRRTVFTSKLFSPGARILIGVSGGPDSVALLHLLTLLRPAWRLTLHLAHLDHGLRNDSRQDAEFVRQLGHDWGVPATIERREVDAICHRQGWSLEDGARRIRYEFLQEAARNRSMEYVALAHTADDQAETVLMRLFRGTGLMGLGAMPMQRELGEQQPPASDRGGERLWLIRPLLEVWRGEVVAYLTRAGVTSREDATNADRRFVRNRIRHELLPLLERHYNPNIKVALTQLADQSRWDYAYLRDAANRQWKRLTKMTPGIPRLAISIPVFLRQPKALQRQLVRQAIRCVRGDTTKFEFRHWREAERLFTEQPVGTQLDLPGVRFFREEQCVICQRASSAQDSRPTRSQQPQTVSRAS